MTAPPRGTAAGRFWIRTVHALWLADVRRRLNLLTGAGPEAHRRRRTARAVVACGAAAVLGTLVVLGRTLGTLVPPGPGLRTDLATWTWTPVVLAFLAQTLSAEPAKARALVRPPDEDVLRTLPVSRAQLVTARLVIPAAGVAVGLLTAAAAVAVPWLMAGAEGRRALPVLLVHALGVAVSGVALRVTLVTAFMVRAVRVPHLPRLVVAAVVGGLIGVVASPVARALARGGGPSEAELTRIVGDAVTASRPAMWTELHRPGTIGWVATAYAAVTVLLGTCAVLRVRATVRRDAHPSPGDRLLAPSPGGRRTPWPSSPYRAVWRLTWLRLLRGHPQTVGGLARLQRWSVLLGAVCLGLVLTAGQPVWRLPFTAVAALFVAIALITTGEVAQVCGIEADRDCWDALRQSPRPTGAWVAAKVTAAAVAVGAVTAPLCLGAAALCGIAGAAAWARTVLAVGVVSLGAGCATVLTYFCVPRPEAFSDGRVTRAPAADVTEGVFVALFTVPVTAGAGLSAALADGTVETPAHCALLAASLAAGYAVLRVVAGRDLPAAGPGSAAHLPHDTPAAPSDRRPRPTRQQKAGTPQ
ncbi:hypothetical protein [Streptomyces lanatus]|uniref:ABC-2 type transport system permease protein n=1 Tax=Streptomyces lanatus TaxID=66900 RepID=A0ABV1XI61_9ACTN|nr:hypothetical protein [Streptomyces lanatus]GHG93284.1 hypothetical protein GCM10018780_15590 [Streptomyces lanatus]